jgi:hypothetical protein
MTIDMACMIGFSFRKRFVSWLCDIFLLQTEWSAIVAHGDGSKEIQKLSNLCQQQQQQQQQAAAAQFFFWTPMCFEIRTGTLFVLDPIPLRMYFFLSFSVISATVGNHHVESFNPTCMEL